MHYEEKQDNGRDKGQIIYSNFLDYEFSYNAKPKDKVCKPQIYIVGGSCKYVGNLFCLSVHPSSGGA